MDKKILAYLAGCMDSDGHFSIKRSTYHARVRGDAQNPIFMERIGLKQVTPVVPKLLHEMFGGSCRLNPGANERSRPLWAFSCTDAQAARAVALLRPYVRIKKKQVDLLLELRETKKDPGLRQHCHWFLLENPNWKKGDLLTSSEVVEILGYSSTALLSQALKNRTVVGLPYDRSGEEKPRFPKKLIEILRDRGRARPPQLIAWRERLYQECRMLNKIGTLGTPVTHRTGVYKPEDDPIFKRKSWKKTHEKDHERRK